MPFTATTVLSPLAGKRAELRNLLEERIRLMQSSGLRANLATTAFAEEAVFYANIVFSDLAAADSFRDGSLTPQADPGFATKIGALVSQPVRNTLREVLVAAMPGQGSSTIRYNLMTTLVPQPAHARQVATKVLAQVQAEQAGGRMIGLSAPVAGARGLQVARLFPSLAELQAYREGARGDAAFQKHVDETLPLMAEPPAAEIREVLIPLPPA